MCASLRQPIHKAAMKAIGFSAPHPIDHPEALVEFELLVPEPGPRDVRVRVHAVSVNPSTSRCEPPRDRTRRACSASTPPAWSMRSAARSRCLSPVTRSGTPARLITAANLRTAHAKVEQGRSIGKTVLNGW